MASFSLFVVRLNDPNLHWSCILIAVCTTSAGSVPYQGPRVRVVDDVPGGNATGGSRHFWRFWCLVGRGSNCGPPPQELHGRAYGHSGGLSHARDSRNPGADPGNASSDFPVATGFEPGGRKRPGRLANRSFREWRGTGWSQEGDPLVRTAHMRDGIY
jgi:hypothetical protein